jgi:hypothetical protein
LSPAAAFAKVDIFLLFWRLTLPQNPFIIETDFIRGFIIMNFKTIMKVISAIVAIAGVAVAVYLAIQKLTAPKEAEYFDDSDFFECDNDLEIVETAAADTQVQEKAEPAEKKAPAKKSAPKKKAPAKKAAK